MPQVQIGGPAGAFIVIVYGIVERYGLPNLLISCALAGMLLFAMGAMKLGGLVRYVPVSIVIGFTNGIAVLIALSQVKDLLGLSIAKMPSDFFAQLQAIWQHIDSVNPTALALGAICLGGLFLWARLFSPGGLLPVRLLEGRTVRGTARLPGSIVALVLGYCGGQLPDDPVIPGLKTFILGDSDPNSFVWLSRIAALYYFAYFVVITPLLGLTEKTLPVPDSIATPALTTKA